MDTKQFVQSLQKLSNGYIEACTQGAQRYMDLLGRYEKSGTTQAIDWTWQKRYAEYVRDEAPRVLKRLADAGLDYYTVVLRSGIEAGNRFYEEVLRDGRAPSTAAATGARQALLFRGSRGDSPSNAFRVSNSQNEAVDVAFTIAGLVSEDGKDGIQPAVTFEPARLRLEPGAEQVVICTLPLPDGLRPDTTYRGKIHVTGFPSMAIDIAVQLDAPAQESRPASAALRKAVVGETSPHEASAKGVAPKKTARKKKAAKRKTAAKKTSARKT